MSEKTTAPLPLRDLFPDKESVLIYPDDFPENQKDIVISDLVDRSVGHFSDKRVAVLFRPTTQSYEDINFPVGYWTQVLGLGETPEDVRFTGRLGIHAIPANTENPGVGSLDTFWRSAENFVSDTSFVRNPENGGAWSVPVGDPSDLTPTSGRGGNETTTKEEGKQFKNLYPLPGGFENESDYTSEKGMIWAVSQAAPLRRVRVTNNLHLSLGNNYASGGFVSNMDIGGYLLFGTQQQFCVRNSGLARKAVGGAWSFVFNGCTFGLGSLQWVQPNGMVVNEPTTDVQIEKPFVFISNQDENLYLAIPKMKRNSQGSDHRQLDGDEKVLIDNKDLVKVVQPSDTFQSVQDAASRGVHIILSPGIYNWNKTLRITKDDQVILGIGMATIQAPPDGTSPCVHVASGIGGVRISGVSLEASAIPEGAYAGSSLLEWGEPGEKEEERDPGDPNNPGAIHDLYCFVGGRSESRDVKVEVMVRIYSGNIVGDNLWLWRADHVKLAEGEKPNKPDLSEYHVTTYGECKCDTGLEVHGDNVLFHGLAVEHTYSDMVSWHGKNGSVHFYQSELPYDVPGKYFKNKAGYRVHETGEGHSGNGIGVYSYFRDYDDVEVDSAIAHHAKNGNYNNSFTVWLDGYGKNAIRSVINGIGGTTLEQGIPVKVKTYSYPGGTTPRHHNVGAIPLWAVKSCIAVVLGMILLVFLSRSRCGATLWSSSSSSSISMKEIPSEENNLELIGIGSTESSDESDDGIKRNPSMEHFLDEKTE